MSLTSLSNTIELIERSIFHSIRLELVDKGFLPDVSIFPDTDQGVIDYNTALADIATNQGYAIEVFNNSSPHAKNLQRVPRIVFVPGQFLPGALGGDMARQYVINNEDPLKPNHFRASIQPPQTTDFNFEIYIIGKEARQIRTMLGIVALALPKRGYIKLYNEPDKKIFLRQISYRSQPDNTFGVNEHIYMYQVQDVFETEPINVGNLIPPINNIQVDTQVNDGGPIINTNIP